MKRLFVIVVIVAAVMASLAGCAEEAAGAEEATGAEAATASIGDVAFSFANEQDYFDVTYKYPDGFELEISEDGDRVRHLLRYHVEGYDPKAVGIVVSRTNEYTQVGS